MKIIKLLNPLHLIIVFGHMMNLKKIKLDILNLIQKNLDMLINKKYIKQ